VDAVDYRRAVNAIAPESQVSTVAPAGLRTTTLALQVPEIRIRLRLSRPAIELENSNSRPPSVCALVKAPLKRLPRMGRSLQSSGALKTSPLAHGDSIPDHGALDPLAVARDLDHYGPVLGRVATEDAAEGRARGCSLSRRHVDSAR